MPDLDIVAFACCESVIHDQIEVPSSSGSTYNVAWEPAPPDHEYGYWWHCECKGFQYRRECKHTAQAEAEHCGWDAFLHKGEPVEIDGERCCPWCYGPVTAQRYGV